MEAEFSLPTNKRFLDRRLAGVMRFGRITLNNPKSVAEHTYEVVRNVRWICMLLKDKGVEVDELAAVDKALVHDEEEIVTGDIVHPVKHGKRNDGQEEIIRKAFDTIAAGAVAVLYDHMPESVKSHYIQMWDEYKKRETIEAQIVKLADIISGLAECEEEKALGNSTIQGSQDNYQRLYREFLRECEWVGCIKEFLP